LDRAESGFATADGGLSGSAEMRGGTVFFLEGHIDLVRTRRADPRSLSAVRRQRPPIGRPLFETSSGFIT